MNQAAGNFWLPWLLTPAQHRLVECASFSSVNEPGNDPKPLHTVSPDVRKREWPEKTGNEQKRSIGTTKSCTQMVDSLQQTSVTVGRIGACSLLSASKVPRAFVENILVVIVVHLLQCHSNYKHQAYVGPNCVSHKPSAWKMARLWKREGAVRHTPCKMQFPLGTANKQSNTIYTPQYKRQNKNE